MMTTTKFYTITLLAVCTLYGLLLMSCTPKNSEEIDLAGKWSFRIDNEDIGEKEQWYTGNFTESIILPGSMPEQQKGHTVGYDTKFTGNMWASYADTMEWFDDENYKPYLSEDTFRYPFWLIADYYYTGAAWYQKEIDIPDNWADKDIELFLERCHWETRVWVNEKFVGMQNALGVPHRYSIGKHLNTGKNKITICVDNRVKDIKVGDDAHSVSDNTQSNWNGIVGNIKLTRKDLVSIANVAIFPDVEKQLAKIEIDLKNTSGKSQSGKLKIKAKSLTSSARPIAPVTQSFHMNTKGKVLVELPMGKDVLLWDEYAPNLYELTIELNAKPYSDICVETFGMRDFYTKEKHFEINGRPVFLRGTLECAIFPKTGYPPTDVSSWERIITVCKAHGLNHIRFHSWCPPEAAFEAADKLGFYYQVEASAWTHVGDGDPIDQWIYDESERMVKAYGNHPSFCLMPYGNEPHGKNHKAYLTEFVKYWKAKDSRRVYTTAAGWPVIPENDYNNIHRGTRIQGWNQNLNSIINREAPRSDYDWEQTIANHSAPMVSHEVGQWCVYPNFKEIDKYDGVLKATNFEIFRASLEAHGMLHLADSFLLASGKLQTLCYKADIEAAMRTEGFGGFQLLDLHDFPGQGTALVGVLDPFWEEKGYVSPEEFKRFCNETVPLARFKKMIFTNEEHMEAAIEIAHYGKKELTAVVPTWQIKDVKGTIIRKGELNKTNIHWGNCQTLGKISEVIEAQKAGKYTLIIEVAGYENDWDFWVYPEELPEEENDIYLASELTEEAMKVLENGGNVLLSTEKGSIKEGKGGEVAVGFSSIFWNTAWTNGQKPHTLGILCDPKHPALADFPTEYHSNWQWWDAMSHSNVVNLESFNSQPELIVRVIDDWVTNRPLGLVFEAKVGKGKLIFSGIDLHNNMENRPEARQLLFSLRNYMMNEKFDPLTILKEQEVKSIFN